MPSENQRMNCRTTLLILLCTTSPLFAEKIAPSKARRGKSGKLWYDVRLVGVEGQGWAKTKAPFDRLPAKAEKIVRKPVWGLSRHSAGLCVRFVTDATTLYATWKLTSSRLAMPHMPATGVSGLDLYVKTNAGKWRWLAVGRPTKQANTARLFAGIPAGKREFLLYLPLYNGVQSVEIGIPKSASIWTPAPRKTKPVLFYGTSITQGGCASRTGMVHTAILGRRLNRSVINLGFSGNGRMEQEMAELFAELDPAVFVLDCLPNMNGKMVSERVEPFVKILRKKRPDTPILLVEDRSYTDSFLFESKRRRNAENRKALRKAFKSLQSAGVKHLYYLSGEKLLGDDGEGTVDSSHPTDLGFMRQAAAFEPVLRKILKSTER